MSESDPIYQAIDNAHSVTTERQEKRSISVDGLIGTAPRRVLTIGLMVALAYLVQFPFFSLPLELGSDWWWYRDGIDNLAAGGPLYDSNLLVGPYTFVDPAHVYSYNVAPWVVAIVAPFVALGDFGREVWFVAMAVATGLAILLCVPSRHRLVAAVILLLSPAVLMLLAWGNLGSLVVLGVAIWLVGWRRDSNKLMTVGLILASVKILPAVPLAVVMLRERRFTSVAIAAVVTGGITVALSLATGRNVLADNAVALTNIGQLPMYNLAPSAFLGHPTEIRIGAVVALVALAVPRPTYWTILAMELVVCAFVTNLYLDWAIAPVLIALAFVSDRLESRSSMALPA